VIVPGPAQVPPVARSTSSSIARPWTVGGALACATVTGLGSTTGVNAETAFFSMSAHSTTPVSELPAPQSRLKIHSTSRMRFPMSAPPSV
jgi:hypothetical protein